MNETIYCARVDSGLIPVGDDDRAWMNRYGSGELVAFDRPKVRNRDPKDHRRFFVLIRVGFENQPDAQRCEEIGLRYFDTPDEFRYAWTAECGHVDTWADLRGNLHCKPKSLAFNETTNDELLSLAKTLREKWIRTYGSEWTEEIFDETARLTGGGNWQ